MIMDMKPMVTNTWERETRTALEHLDNDPNNAVETGTAGMKRDGETTTIANAKEQTMDKTVADSEHMDTVSTDVSKLS